MEEIIKLPRSFIILSISCAMKYEITDGKIVIENEVFAYLEDTYIYFDSFNDDMSEGFRKYRLQSRFEFYK